MTAAPVFQLPDFVAAFQRLMPRGRVWPREPDSTQTAAVTALMPTYVRQAARANNLLRDAFPATTDELLPDWEAALGLPDPCAGPDPALQQRQNAVVARLTGRGGQSVLYITNYAAALGYPITVTQYAPFRVGFSTVGQPLNNSAWAFAWQVNAPLTTVTYFRVGQSAVGEPLRAWGNADLECEIRRIAPAHTTVTFAYH